MASIKEYLEFILGQSILTGNIKFIKAYIVQKHIDAAQVVSCDIDFLSEETVADSISAKNFFCFQKERTRAAGRIDTTTLEQEQDELLEETQVVSDMVQQCI